MSRKLRRSAQAPSPKHHVGQCPSPIPPSPRLLPKQSHTRYIRSPGSCRTSLVFILPATQPPQSHTLLVDKYRHTRNRSRATTLSPSADFFDPGPCPRTLVYRARACAFFLLYLVPRDDDDSDAIAVYLARSSRSWPRLLYYLHNCEYLNQGNSRRANTVRP